MIRQLGTDFVVSLGDGDISRDSERDDIFALVDLWTLAGCNEIISSEHSTFGYVAHGLASLRPWVVSHRASGCSRSKLSQPCFHAFKKVESGINDKCPVWGLGFSGAYLEMSSQGCGGLNVDETKI